MASMAQTALMAIQPAVSTSSKVARITRGERPPAPAEPAGFARLALFVGQAKWGRCQCADSARLTSWRGGIWFGIAFKGRGDVWGPLTMSETSKMPLARKGLHAGASGGVGTVADHATIGS